MDYWGEALTKYFSGKVVKEVRLCGNNMEVVFDDNSVLDATSRLVSSWNAECELEVDAYDSEGVDAFSMNID